jgi:hypothetical protein
MTKTKGLRGGSLLVLLFAMGACGPRPPAPEGDEGSAPTFEEAQTFLEEAARKERAARADLSFEQFKEQIYREPFEGGKFIVNGDTPIVDEKQLEEFFETKVKQEPELFRMELIVHQVGGLDAVWNRVQKKALTYCVSTEFDVLHSTVVQGMETAAGAWEAVADVDFIHEESEDADCTAANENVVFDVRLVDVGQQYLARAFFPNEPRPGRNVLIDESAFDIPPDGALSLVGILRHELGHTLGFRHEHTRPNSGECFEDSDWRPLTDYDAFSVMHYPQCNGLGDWSLTLTDTDRNGAACLYGAAEGFTIDTTICEPEVPGEGEAGEARTRSFPDQSVALHEEKEYGPFAVTPGSGFEAEMGGDDASGDPDLYVRFDRKPTRFDYDCRPYLIGPNESCAVDVPAEKSEAFVMVRGYAEGTYDLEVTHAPPAE